MATEELVPTLAKPVPAQVMLKVLGSFHVLFMLLVVCTGLYWLQCDCIAAGNVHYAIELYSGIYMSICPLEVMYAELLASRLG